MAKRRFSSVDSDVKGRAVCCCHYDKKEAQFLVIMSFTP